MGRSISEIAQTTSGIEVGQVAEFIDGKDVILSGSYVKANGQELLKTEYASLYNTIGDSIEYSDFNRIVGTTTTNQFGTNANYYKPTYCKIGTKFVMVGQQTLSAPIYVSTSDDGISWTFPEAPTSAGTFNGIRAIGTDLFIMTSGGLYISQDYGKTFTQLYYTAVYDIAYNGTTYVITLNTVNVLTTTNLKTFTTISAGATYSTSIVWTGVNFVIAQSSLTDIRISTNGTTWSSGGSMPYIYTSGGSTASTGNKLYYINGNVVAFCGETKLFSYSSNNGTTWVESSTAVNTSAGYIEWDGTNYIIVLPSATTTVIKMTTLATTPTSYTLPTIDANSGFCMYNGTKYLYSCYNANVGGYLYVDTLAPTTNITSTKLMGNIFSAYNYLSDGVLFAPMYLNNVYNWTMYKYDNHVYTPIEVTLTSYTLFTGVITSLMHYAKDAGMLYYSKLVVTTASIPVFMRTIDIDTGLVGDESSAVVCLITTEFSKVYKHSNGVFMHSTTNCCSFYGSTAKISAQSFATAPNSVFVSHDGKEIIISLNTSLATYYSTDAGLTFRVITSTAYSSTGALVTPSFETVNIYKLNNIYYTRGGYSGDTPYILRFDTNAQVVSSVFFQAIDKDLLVNVANGATQVMSSPSGVLNITTNVGTTCGSGQHLSDGSVFIGSTSGSSRAYLMNPVTDATKFRVSRLSNTSHSKAYYIKAI